GKLESPISPGVASVEAVLKQNEYYKNRALSVLDNEVKLPGSVGKEGYQELFTKGYIEGSSIIEENDLGRETQYFVFQVYSCNQESFDFSFEVTTLQRLIHRESIAIQPGFNQHIIPLRISTPPYRQLVESRDMLLARIIPQNDYEAHVVILMAELANLKKEYEDSLVASSQEGASAAALLGAKRQVIPCEPASKVKCVCWDLDNTVWAGTLIESDPATLELRPGVRETIEELDRRGIVQMIVSKNQEEDVLPVLGHLNLDKMFVYKFINWNAKSANILRIAELLNINVDTFAFVDDQPFERAEVHESLPCVRVFSETEVPGLLDAPAFDVPRTSDGSKRRLMYQTEAQRRAVAQGFEGNNIDFIRSCNLEIEIMLPETDVQKMRCYELVQRTNQLNLSGRRYEEQAF
ncbi:MAG: HAD-IIIC family phosphatase, partial [Bacteroides sp.]